MTAFMVDAAIGALAATQAGAFSRHQALSLGATAAIIKSRLSGGRWINRGDGVYTLAWSPESYLQELWVAHLRVGALSVVSHEAAARRHGFIGFAKSGVVLTAKWFTHRELGGATVHQISDVFRYAAHRMELDGLAHTTPARTIMDLAGLSWVRVGRLAVLVDDASASGAASYSQVGTCLRDVARKGKPGVRKLAAVLDERGPGDVPGQSAMEKKFFAALHRYGEPLPLPQFPFPGRQMVKGTVDAFFKEELLICECDGRRWHTRIADIKRDRERDAEAARAGCLTLRFLWEHLVDDDRATVELVRDTRLMRRRQLGLPLAP